MKQRLVFYLFIVSLSNSGVVSVSSGHYQDSDALTEYQDPDATEVGESRSLSEDKETPDGAKLFFAIRGKMLAGIATDLSDFYAKTTEEFANFIELTDVFTLDSTVEDPDDLNADLLAAKLTLMRTLHVALQSFIKDLSEISLNAVTHPQHDELERAVRLLLNKSRAIFSSIIETSGKVLTSLSTNPNFEKPVRTRVASSFLTITNNKLGSFSNMLQQIANALQNKQNSNSRLDISNVVSGIEQFYLIDMRIKNSLLLSALHAEIEAANSENGVAVGPLNIVNQQEDDLQDWMDVLNIY